MYGWLSGEASACKTESLRFESGSVLQWVASSIDRAREFYSRGCGCNSCAAHHFYRPVTQRAECRSYKADVGGLNPSRPTNEHWPDSSTAE